MHRCPRPSFRSRCVLAGLLAAVLLSGCALAPVASDIVRPGGLPSSPYDRIRQVNTRIGAMDLDDERWGRLDSPTVLGLDYVESIGLDWFALEGGLTWAYDEAGAIIPGGDDAGQRVEESLAFFEFSAGVLLTPPPGLYRLRPYVGGGASILWTDVDSIVDDALFDDDDNGLGAYAKTGILFQVTDDTHIGIEVRWLDSEAISAGDRRLSLDGMTVAVVFGASFDWFAW